MDPLAAALCGLGAMALFGNDAREATGSLILFVAFYGVHRVLRTGVSRALIAAPAVIWFLSTFWSFVPDSIARNVRAQSPLLERVPANLAAIVLIVALIVMIATAGARLGNGLKTMSLVALGLALVTGLVPTDAMQNHDDSLSVLALGTETGWHVVARLLSALCIFMIGLGPIAVQPLPRRGGAIAGAAGAVLLCASIAGLPNRIAPNSEGAFLVFGLLWLASNVLCAVGLGAMAKAGGKPAAWIGLGLVVFGIVGIFPALAVFDKTDTDSYGFVMSTPFGLLGIGIALLGWKGAPLETARKALAIVFMAAFAGGTLAWMGTYLALAGVTNTRDPWAIAQITTAPLATYGLALWGALLAYLAFPPSAAASYVVAAPPPIQGPIPLLQNPQQWEQPPPQGWRPQ